MTLAPTSLRFLLACRTTSLRLLLAYRTINIKTANLLKFLKTVELMNRTHLIPESKLVDCIYCSLSKVQANRVLPKTVKGYDSIWVIVDPLTKSTHLIPIRTGIFVTRLVEIYIEKIVRLHCIPSSIVSDRDPRFASKIWESLQAALGTKLRLSFTYHPQTDGQTEVEFCFWNKV